MTKQVFGLVVGVIGMTMVVINSNWLVAIGVFLMVTGNNFERSK